MPGCPCRNPGGAWVEGDGDGRAGARKPRDEARRGWRSREGPPCGWSGRVLLTTWPWPSPSLRKASAPAVAPLYSGPRRMWARSSAQPQPAVPPPQQARAPTPGRSLGSPPLPPASGRPQGQKEEAALPVTGLGTSLSTF